MGPVIRAVRLPGRADCRRRLANFIGFGVGPELGKLSVTERRRTPGGRWRLSDRLYAVAAAGPGAYRLTGRTRADGTRAAVLTDTAAGTCTCRAAGPCRHLEACRAVEAAGGFVAAPDDDADDDDLPDTDLYPPAVTEADVDAAYLRFLAAKMLGADPAPA